MIGYIFSAAGGWVTVSGWTTHDPYSMLTGIGLTIIGIGILADREVLRQRARRRDGSGQLE
jgi:hypothetical protein